MINVIYIPAGRAVWLDVAKELKIAKFDIKIWLGDPKLDDRAKELFPSCNVENFFRVNKGLLGKRKIVHTPSREILLDKKFFVLKDKVYKIMDRQDDIRRFSRLEREAVFYLWFNYYYNIIVDENIKLLVASEAPHSPVGMVLYGLCEILNIPRYHLMQSGVAPLMHVCKDFYGTVVNVCRNEKVASIFKDIYTDYVSSFSSSPEEPLYMINQKKHDIKKERLGIIKYLELFGKGVKYSRKKKQRNSYAINNNFFMRIIVGAYFLS
ncbi:hypothetical protein [Vibrio navarrensis]|uniref:hypothetical protein n=1 Tax=Vibrio navarrensis TaxID=29495 RepID=UPI00186A5CE4|nr:hypothetical protein [Vibrio navarrensis]MBE4616851.1 hypothetical protein [Vibrio navarrensis]